MQPKTFDHICQLVYAEAGIRIRKGKESMVAARLAKRIRALELPDELAYLEYLGRELQTEVVALLDVISTNVTSFYREAEHFATLAEIHGEAVRAGRRRLRYWCAASSSGEEPYTIAMTLREVERKLGTTVDTRVLATDISTRVLSLASAGVYSEEQTTTIDEALLRRYFIRHSTRGGVEYRVTDELRARVVFCRLNLSQWPFPMRGPLEAVFCRNVMIYFDDPMRNGVLDECHRLLSPTGALFLGKSEGLPGGRADFARVGSSVFRKVG
jgi:chemotaxis protein methyltransferase CheR